MKKKRNKARIIYSQREESRFYFMFSNSRALYSSVLNILCVYLMNSLVNIKIEKKQSII